MCVCVCVCVCTHIYIRVLFVTFRYRAKREQTAKGAMRLRLVCREASFSTVRKIRQINKHKGLGIHGRLTDSLRDRQIERYTPTPTHTPIYSLNYTLSVSQAHTPTDSLVTAATYVVLI